MNRFELERCVIADSGSPIAQHSTNQRCLKIAYDRGRCFSQDVPRKIQMAEKRHSRRLKELEKHKVERVLSRVLAVFNGFDGFDGEVFSKELAFLKRNGINPRLTTEDSSI